jgi:hypothetical protein
MYRTFTRNRSSQPVALASICTQNSSRAILHNYATIMHNRTPLVPLPTSEYVQLPRLMHHLTYHLTSLGNVKQILFPPLSFSGSVLKVFDILHHHLLHLLLQHQPNQIRAPNASQERRHTMAAHNATHNGSMAMATYTQCGS